jgi:hypothetical protein
MQVKFVGNGQSLNGFGIPQLNIDQIVGDEHGEVVAELKSGSIVKFDTAGVWWIDNDYLQVME